MIYLELFLTFFKIGLFTFGGGYAMLPLIQEEVLAHGWIDNQSIVNFIAVSESTPGPFAINIATYVGIIAEDAGIFGAICSTLGVVMPSFLVILLVAKFYEKFKENRIVSGCMTGLKPAVIGLIASAILGIGQTVFFPAGLDFSVFTELPFYLSLTITAVALFLVIKKKLHPILLICGSAVIGIVAGYLLDLPV